MPGDEAVAPIVVNVITGPTAAGKSAIALELARRLNLSLISADSRQVYRGFDIGTAKPTASERAEVIHYGVDVCDPLERYSAQAWANAARDWLQQACAAGRQPVVVGGTGFYIRALVRPLAPTPEIDAVRREQLGNWLRQQDSETLRQWCARLDPARAGLGRTQLERAIETALLTGLRLSDVHVEQRVSAADGQEAPAVSVRYLVVDPGLVLADRIRTRVHQMVENGWVDEVTALQHTVPATAPAWLASGYGVMQQYVAGQITRDAAIERIVIETRQYAKRQRTWSRHQLSDGSVTRISLDEPHAIDRAIAWARGTEANL